LHDLKLNRESATLGQNKEPRLDTIYNNMTNNISHIIKTINENPEYATGTEIYFKIKLSIIINNYQTSVRMSVTCHQRGGIRKAMYDANMNNRI